MAANDDRTLANHPLLAFFPQMMWSTFQVFKHHLQANGQYEPILTFNALIVDGPEQYRACLDLGIKPWIQEWRGQEQDLLDFICSRNPHRTHLSCDQLACVASEFLEWATDHPREQFVYPTPHRFFPAKIAIDLLRAHRFAGEGAAQWATAFGVDPINVHHAIFIRCEDPELYYDVKAGELGIQDAFVIVHDAIEDAAFREYRER